MDDFHHRAPTRPLSVYAEMLTEVRIALRPQRQQRVRQGGSACRRLGRVGRRPAQPSGWTDDVIADARVGLAAVGPNTTGIPADLRGVART